MDDRHGERLDPKLDRHGERLEQELAELGGRPPSPELLLRADAAIAAGMAQGRLRRRSRRRWQRLGSAALTLALVLAVGLASIRISPAFASAVRQLPGMAAIVDAIREEYSLNRTVQDALDEGYLQPLHLTQEHEGVKVTLEGLVADDYRMMFVYTVAGLGENEHADVGKVKALDRNGQSVIEGAGFSFDGREEAVKRQTMELMLQPGCPLPDWLDLQVEVNGAPYRFQFPVDRELFADKSRTLPLEETISIENQQLRFTSMRISPLSVAIEAEYDPANTMKLYGPVDMKLTDDSGTEWGGVGYSAGSLEEHKVRFEFQSPYFRQPKSLYLSGKTFRALPKDKGLIVLDAEKGELLAAPDDRLKLISSSVDAKGMKLGFELRVDGPDSPSRSYSVLGSDFTDADGRSFGLHLQGGTETSDPDGRQKLSYTYGPGDYKQPLTFEISNYPNYIEGEYRIRLPLEELPPEQ